MTEYYDINLNHPLNEKITLKNYYTNPLNDNIIQNQDNKIYNIVKCEIKKKVDSHTEKNIYKNAHRNSVEKCLESQIIKNKRLFLG